MSGELNAIVLNDAPDMLDDTHFGHTAKSRKKGLDVITADLEGFFEAETSDKYFSTLGVPDVPLTIAPEPTIGGPAYNFLSQNVEYKWGGTVGEMGKFSVKAESVGTKMIRGNILENGATARTASLEGTAFELGAVAADKYLYGVIHVISAASLVGDTLDVIIESDTEEAFGDTPETQITFTQVLGNGGTTYEWATPIAGAITDTWWRTAWTIAGAGDHTFSFVVFMGIAD